MALPPRSVWIDAQGCQSRTHFERGIARQVAELTRALIDLNEPAVHTVGLNPELPLPAALQTLFGSGRLGWVAGKGTSPDPPPALYHVTSPFEGSRLDLIWPGWARRDGVRTVVTLHDLIPLLYPGRYWGPSGTAAYEARVELVRTADHVLSVSEASAADAVERLGLDESRITVIDAGVSPRLASMVVSPGEAAQLIDAALPQVRDRFLLYVGGDDWRKNLDGMISAFGALPAELRSDRQLVIVCKLSEERRSELERHARHSGIGRGELVLTGYVPDRELVALYRTCELFVFPSLYEGSGLPILEAMSCGAPVAASRTTSIPEVLGDLRATFDPEDPADIARSIAEVLRDGDQLKALRARSEARAEQCTWERVAEKALEGYERALAAPGRGRPGRARKRLAVFAPWPPEEPGTSMHVRRLVEQLAGHADVDVFAPGGAEAPAYDRSLEPDVHVWAAGVFESMHALNDYDRILYVLGRTPLHVPALDALLRRSGAVLALDVDLSPLYAALRSEHYRFVPEWLPRKLSEMYGERIPEDELARIPDGETEVRFGAFMTQEVQAQAERILVHSSHAAEALRMDCPPGRAAAITDVVEHGIPEPPDTIERRPRPDAPVLVAPAADDHLEGTEVLLHAFAELRSERTDAALTLLGSVGEETGKALRATVSRLGIGDAVSVVDRPRAEADYWELLAEADLAAQIQTVSEGEASGLICDCLSLRIPALVSDIGWSKDLPKGVALRAPHAALPTRIRELITLALDDGSLRERMRVAQDHYAAEASFARVAERYAELLAL